MVAMKSYRSEQMHKLNEYGSTFMADLLKRLKNLLGSKENVPLVETQPLSSIKTPNESNLEVIVPQECFLVTEVSEGEPIVGDLFRRRFHTDTFPDTPCHYIAFVRHRGGLLRPVGYVHYTLLGDIALCGGLVIDNRQFRLLPKITREYLHKLGGVAELLLRQSFELLPRNISTIWGHVGDLQSEKVCLRVGFERTREKHLLVVWRNDTISAKEQERLIDQVSALTPF